MLQNSGLYVRPAAINRHRMHGLRCPIYGAAQFFLDKAENME